MPNTLMTNPPPHSGLSAEKKREKPSVLLQQKRHYQRLARSMQDSLDALALEARRHKILSAREYYLYKLRFHNGMLLEEAGKDMGVTRERIRQLETAILQKLEDYAFPPPSHD